MANSAKRKGDAHERRVRDYLNSEGLNVSRIPAGAKNDVGDLWGVPGWAWQAKNVKADTLSESMNDAKKQAHNAGVDSYVVVKHRNNKPVEEAFAILPLSKFVELLKISMG